MEGERPSSYNCPMEERLPAYIAQWTMVLRGMQVDNTYKCAWARSILSCLGKGKFVALLPDGKAMLHFSDIAKEMVRLYWNQSCFFHLRQAPEKRGQRGALIVSYVEDLIESYYELLGTRRPSWWSEAEPLLREEKGLLDSAFKEVERVLPENVAHRFLNLRGHEGPLPLYEYRRPEKAIYFESWQVKLLLSYKDLLEDEVDFRWTEILEKFNGAPRIASKIISSSNEEVKRESLKDFKDVIQEAYRKVRIPDFYEEGSYVPLDDFSLDHVIPWSYLYSDDIWNLVPTRKGNNSAKGDSLPKEEDIARLKRRNRDLLPRLEGVKGAEKHVGALLFAEENHLVDIYYAGCLL